MKEEKAIKKTFERTCGTWHILKQVEWYNKLKSEYGCSKVEMEYKLDLKRIVVKNHYRIDVYGENKDNKFIIEIGHCDSKKLEFFKNLSLNNPNIKFFFVPKPI